MRTYSVIPDKTHKFIIVSDTSLTQFYPDVTPAKSGMTHAEAAKLLTKLQAAAPAPVAYEMELNNLLISTGYVGSMGITWETPTQEDLEKAILGAMEIEAKNRDEIVTILKSGKSVRWCHSPNYYYDHSYGKIGTKRTPKPVELIMCDCGHEVPDGQRMTASLGTSCSDCFDRMSD